LELWDPQTKQTNLQTLTLDETTGKLTARSSETMMASQLAFMVEEDQPFRRVPAPTTQ